MEFLHDFFEFVLHMDKHLRDITENYGLWTYAILMLIIFAETGLVVTPFLPGDSLLFATGAIASSMGTLNIWVMFCLLFFAAVVGNVSNYRIGCFLGPAVFNKKDSRIFNAEYLEMTRGYFERYGGKTVVIGRFLPIIRTFAPFVAGIGRMTWPQFMKFNLAGAFLWVGLFLGAGYFFGNIPSVKRNFSAVIIAIIIISVMPALVEYLRHKKRSSEK